MSDSIKFGLIVVVPVFLLAGSCKSDHQGPAEKSKEDASNYQLEERLSVEAQQASSLFGPDYDICAVKSDGVTVAILQCIEAEYERQDAVLNIRYQKLMRQLPRERARNLLQIQRGWIREKTMDCTADATAYGQSAVIQQAHCELNKTAIRAEQLRRMLDDIDNPAEIKIAASRDKAREVNCEAINVATALAMGSTPMPIDNFTLSAESGDCHRFSYKHWSFNVERAQWRHWVAPSRAASAAPSMSSGPWHMPGASPG